MFKTDTTHMTFGRFRECNLRANRHFVVLGGTRDEIALRTNDDLPTSICRLLEDGSHAKTSGVLGLFKQSLDEL